MSIHDEETNSFIQALTTEEIWVGGYRKEDEKNVWEWTDGSPWEFSKWSSGEPNDDNGVGDYLDMSWGGKGLWNDRQKNDKLAFVCQRCKSGWQYFLQNKKCYKYFSTKVSPSGANDLCNSLEVKKTNTDDENRLYLNKNKKFYPPTP